ncbi:polar amino acid transport system substrate-binding protein [Oceanospirillum multiglobuliferum]|uniref:substrate-binding periplasmic protein n=1 Tax=Oceanospirillum multiglobuliferum TaxID=64969 RepID=UPI00099A9030|nr:transporter substrate-binding domain-containing protein [Oceanospirillum multiglobuliferum]SJZ71189.1 polar amino acid transport system substrate-binding protein [Oceanospirillum multiglobuliferum]
MNFRLILFQLMSMLILSYSLSPTLEAQIVDSVQQVDIIADDNYPPFSYREGEDAKGLYVEILLAVFKNMPDYQVNIRPLPWRRGLTMMQSGSGFAIFPPYYFPNKRPFLSAYSKPVLNEKISLFCSNKFIAKYKAKQPVWPQDFAGARIGINPGYLLLDDDFWELNRKHFYRVEEGIDTKANIQKLIYQRLDCLINSRVAILWGQKELKESGETFSEGLSDKLQEVAVLKEQQGYLAFSEDIQQRYPFRAVFIKQFNQELSTLIQSGELDRIVHNFEARLHLTP